MRLPITPGSYEPGSMALGGKKGSVPLKPRVEAGKCTQCLACWIFCPDSAVSVAGEAVAIELDHCKGCGICATECPEGAIQMVGVA
ncbi:MAG: 4Fe-4S binding protein [Chloroflexota bacterium]